MMRLQASHCVLMLLTASSCLCSSARRLGTPQDQRDEDHADGPEDYKQRRSLDHYDSETLADMFNGDRFAAVNWWTGKKMGGDDETMPEDSTQSFQEDDIENKVFETGSSWWTPVEPPNTPPQPPTKPVSRPTAPISPPTAPVPPPTAPVSPPTAPVPPPSPPTGIIVNSWWAQQAPVAPPPVPPTAPVSPPTAPVPPPTAPVSPPTAPGPPPSPPTGIIVNSWWAQQAPVAPPPVPPSVAADAVAPPPPPNNFPGSSTLTIIEDNDVIGRCEGDCDSDEKCFGGLVCYQRDGTLTSVPGCFGEPGSRDYCIDPQDNPSNIHKDTFRLKLFWREGYFWQEEKVERPWCMDCFGANCGVGENLKVSECDRGNKEFQFINELDNVAQIYIPANDKCVEARIGELNLKVVECDNSDSAQRFWAGPDGSFNGDRFELIPMSVSQLDECMTQRHHPKEGEVIYREKCETARNDKTNYWNRY